MSVCNHVAASHVVLLRDGKVWLLRRANTHWGDGMYCLPAGGTEVDEFPSVAAVREVLEEAGVAVEAADLKLAAICLVDYCKGKGSELAKCSNYCFVATQWQGEPFNAEPGKCDEAGWFALDDLPEAMLPFVSPALQAVRDNKFYMFEGVCPERLDTTKVVWQTRALLG